tara:strand:+ start:2826 stop:2975 length:150 start_codon:yes stop_codon:yes gene_type:complete
MPEHNQDYEPILDVKFLGLWWSLPIIQGNRVAMFIGVIIGMALPIFGVI